MSKEFELSVFVDAVDEAGAKEIASMLKRHIKGVITADLVPDNQPRTSYSPRQELEMRPNPLTGIVIKRLREERGLSANKTGQRGGLSVGHLSKIERGKVKAEYPTLVRVAAGLDIPVEDLIDSIIAENKNP